MTNRLPDFLARQFDDEALPNPDGVLTAYVALRWANPALSDGEAWERAYEAARALREREDGVSWYVLDDMETTA